MTILEKLRAIFGDFDVETKLVSSSSKVENGWAYDELVFTQGPRRPSIAITIKRHVST